jgi:predicted kinase
VVSSSVVESQGPQLIVVAGPPASGKTTIARQLARALCLPPLCKDALKESLYDHLGSGDRAWSRQLGYAVICTLYALARDILDAGTSLILESTFTDPRAPNELGELIAATGARLTVVYCCADPAVLSARFNARSASDRHPGHLDPVTTTPEDFAQRGWLDCPPYPGRVIHVDTTDWSAVSVPEIVRRLGCANVRSR